MSTELWAIVSTLLLGLAGALAVYARNIAKRSDPNFQKELEDGLLARIEEERAQRRAELSDVKRWAEEERVQRRTELAELKIEHKGELVVERVKFTNEQAALLQKFNLLEARFDKFRGDSEIRYKTDTDALLLRVDAAEKRVELLEKTIVDLQLTVAGLTAENATLKREAGQTGNEA